MTTKIEDVKIGDVVRLKQGTVAAVTAVEKGYINVSWKECGEWHTLYVNISANAILQATKTVNSAKVESAESNCASGKHYFQPMPSNMNIFGYLYCVHCGLRTFGRVE